MRVTILIIAAIVASAARAQTAFYVDGACGDDAWTGLSSTCAAPDGPKRTIQAAIDASAGGDKVLVQPGTYREAIDLKGKAIHVLGAGGSEQTIIDGEYIAHHVIQCVSGEGRDTVLQGFTITRGDAWGSTWGVGGGGLRIDNSGPTVVDCAFVSNRTGMIGGAVLSAGGNPAFIRCRFRGNHGFFGGGDIAIQNGALVIEQCTFEGGVSGDGGAVLAEQTILTVRDSTFEDYETLHGDGGAMCIWGGEAIVQGCQFLRNVAEFGTFGGAIYNEADSMMVIDSVFRNNRAERGSAICNRRGGQTTLINCLFYDELSNHGVDAIIINCTLRGSGFIFNDDSDPVITNSILWTDEPNQLYNKNGSNPSVTRSDVRGGYPGVGNIDADPRFASPTGPSAPLSASSPCIDAGDNLAVPPKITGDLNGMPRFVDSPWTPNTGVPGGAGGTRIVDIGACEYLALCHADCDQSSGVSVLDIFDFLCFQNSFVSGDPYACDCDTSTGPATCDIFDFLCFQSAFTAGCP